jgi:hypothetical protein
MTPTRHRKATMLVALTMLAVGAALAFTATASAATFTVGARVDVIATGAHGTVAVVPDDQHVVVAFDGSGAAVRSYPPRDLALAGVTPDPDPDPVPTPDPGSMLGWNGFGVGAWPTGSWRPYSISSPFNRSTSGQVVHPNSADIVAKTLSLGNIGNLVAGNAGTTSDYGHPTYYAQPTDPLFTLEWTGGGPGAAIDGMQIRIPNAARPAAGADGHMTVVEPDGWEYDFWRVGTKPQGGGTMTFAGGGRTRIDGSGLNSGATASNFGNLAGVIRAQELMAGRIDHALFIVVECTAKGTDFGYGTRTTSNGSMVYPASHGASACSTDSPDLPPVGARFQLAMSDAQIQALPVPGWKRTILTALAHYGGYVGDTGGPGFAFQFESGSTYTSFGVSDKMVDFAKIANGVTNYDGKYVFNMADDVEWAKYLRVLVPPTP